MDDKIHIITSKEISADLKKVLPEDLFLRIQIAEQVREPLFLVKLRAKIWILKSDIRQKIHDLIELAKSGRIEPRLGGGGGFDYESLYGFVANFFTYFIAPNISWELLKLVVKKTYNSLREKRRREYITFASTFRQPMDTLLRLRIPTDLDDQELDRCLENAEEIYSNLDKIRWFFGYHKIIITYVRSYRWDIKFVGKMR